VLFVQQLIVAGNFDFWILGIPLEFPQKPIWSQRLQMIQPLFKIIQGPFIGQLIPSLYRKRPKADRLESSGIWVEILPGRINIKRTSQGPFAEEIIGCMKGKRNAFAILSYTAIDI